MKATYLALAAALAIPASTMAQSAIDAQQASQSDFRGTARFMAMGGAFTALGGDLSSVNQNPAGIGIYRSSEIGATLAIDAMRSNTSPASPEFPSQNSQTKVFCNNFGYIGATQLGGSLKTFNWGVTYNRAASFDRVYSGYVRPTDTSLSNYVAAYSAGAQEKDLLFGKGYNPYLDSSEDWLTILAYNSYLISTGNGGKTYTGLYQNGTNGDALYNVQEKGGVDEYDISFGGNVENVVYWGLCVGITDLNYTRTIFYNESMDNARIYDVSNNGTTTGAAGFDLNSRKYINGTGANIKLGVIVKPINEFRIGFAVHTPTWYNFTQGYDGTIDYRFTNPNLAQGEHNPLVGNEYTEPAYFSWHYSSPWRIMVGAAGVIGGRAIVSLDYQYDGYNNMSIATPDRFDNYVSNAELNGDIKSYFQGSNTVRLGLEYRITPQLSVRAGYNYQTTNVQNAAANGAIEVLTSGTDPSYTFTKNTQHICVGLGYRYKAWYIDAAYVHKHREGTFHAFTNYNGAIAPQSKLTDNNSQFVLSTGFKF